jgi:hypothetical protein
MTAHALRSFLTWPAPRKTCECSSAVTLAVSLEVAMHDVDEFVCGLGARLTGTRSASHEVLADVILDDFRQQAVHGAAARGQQLHDLAAFRILVERPLDRLDLPTKAAEPIDELGPLANGVRHARLISYRGMISKGCAGGGGRSELAAQGSGRAQRKMPGSSTLPSMTHDLVCWKCGAPLAELSLPLRRLEECPKCHAELHVCRMCIEYDTRVAKHCREPTAEEVNDKTHANFCDHFKPRAAAFTPPNTAEVDKARTELEKLFGKR